MKFLMFIMVFVSLVKAEKTLSYLDLNYIFSQGSAKCEKQNVVTKKFIFNEYNQGDVIIINKISTVAGNVIRVVWLNEDKEMYLNVMSSYGACMLYDDVVIKNLDVEVEDYIDLKE